MWDTIVNTALGWLAANPIANLVLAALSILIAAAQAIVTLTPSTADDLFWEKVKAIPILGSVIAWLAARAPFQKKL